jgi:hypothetical protein
MVAMGPGALGDDTSLTNPVKLIVGAQSRLDLIDRDG